MNNEQSAAVEFNRGALLLLAGPGSGKTFVIVNRIQRLIELGIPPEEILVITFTKAAALQMKDRFIKLTGSDETNVTFGTFHAIFYNILKSKSTYSRVHPISDKEKIPIINRAIEIAKIENIIIDFEGITNLLSLISAYKNSGEQLSDYKQELVPSDKFGEVVASYQAVLRDLEKIDFDDMINLCLLELRQDALLRDKWQSRFKYILIDEFQDISVNQYELVKLLAYPEYNIFAVGDDDQSIYRFRGADVSIMKRFLDDIPHAKSMELSVNYRCSGNIVNGSLAVINENNDRFVKHISPSRASGNKIIIYRIYGQNEHTKQIMTIIDRLLSMGNNLYDIAILVRTNRQVNRISNQLVASGYKVNCKTENLYSSKYIKDIMAYLAIAYGDAKRSYFMRIINKPLRYIKRESLISDTITKADLIRYYNDDIKMKRRIENLFFDLGRMKNMSIQLAVRYIRKVIGYDKYVKDNCEFEQYMDYMSEADGFSEFIKGLTNIDDIEKKIEDANKYNERNINDGINIMTYHSSKGLEFVNVILPELNQGTVPSKTAKSIEGIEEERRLFYVAMTRAKDNLFILYRTDEGKKASVFLPVIENNKYSDIY